MSSTNKTVNYELSQFIETDKPGWLTDYNGDMRKLDAGLKSVSDVASGASADLSTLAGRVSTAESAITTNTNDITSLDARADTLEAQASASATAITNLQTEQTTQNLGIEAATKLGYNIARPYDAASTYAVGDYALFQNTLYKCITAIEVGEAFVPEKWLAIKVMDEILPISAISLNADNFPLNASSETIRAMLYDPSTHSSSTVNLANFRAQLQDYNNTYIMANNIRILSFRLIFLFDPVSVNNGCTLSTYNTDFILPSIIDIPSKQAFSYYSDVDLSNSEPRFGHCYINGVESQDHNLRLQISGLNNSGIAKNFSSFVGAFNMIYTTP